MGENRHNLTTAVVYLNEQQKSVLQRAADRENRSLSNYLLTLGMSRAIELGLARDWKTYEDPPEGSERSSRTAIGPFASDGCLHLALHAVQFFLVVRPRRRWVPRYRALAKRAMRHNSGAVIEISAMANKTAGSGKKGSAIRCEPPFEVSEHSIQKGPRLDYCGECFTTGAVLYKCLRNTPSLDAERTSPKPQSIVSIPKSGII